MTATDSNPLIVEGVDTSSLQGDREVCSVLERMGAKLKIEKTRVTCTGGNLHGVTIDGSQIPDIIPILSVVAAVALGESRIINAQRLRLKESDRLSAMAESLSAIGAKLTQTEDGLIIGGSESLDGGMVTSSNDHRIAMAMAVASLRCKAPVVIKQAECVAKSYPDFYQDFKMLGGKADVVNLG